eukprot:10276245-Prorocentrum_lima.AAC.1
MTSSLVGSEMCIRDRNKCRCDFLWRLALQSAVVLQRLVVVVRHGNDSVSYTHLTLPTICSV